MLIDNVSSQCSENSIFEELYINYVKDFEKVIGGVRGLLFEFVLCQLSYLLLYFFVQYNNNYLFYYC